MTVEVYLGEKFHYEHERRAFGRFLQEMLDRYEDTDDLYIVIVEAEANMAAMDLLIITPRALIVVDFKELIYAEGVDSSQIILEGKENGAWKYSLPDGGNYFMGEAGAKNPYRQLLRINYKLGEWLYDHREGLPGKCRSAKEASKRSMLWVVISPGFNRDASNVDLPWKTIRKWFKVLSRGELAKEIGLATHEKIEFSPEQMAGLVEQLGVTRCENLQQFIPTYVPPTARISFFGLPPVPKHFIDRDRERSELRAYLEDPHVSVLSLGGPGGIGKTELAAWLCDEARSRGYRVWWVDCGEKEVTVESLLAAVSTYVTDKYQAALMSDPEQRVADRVDAALGFLDKERSLLVFDCYHEVSHKQGLAGFLTRAIHRARSTKIILATRKRPVCLDDPNWPPGTAREMTLEGLPLDAVEDYIQACEPLKKLTGSQLKVIRERTSGNPYALRLLLAIMRNSGWSDQLKPLPLYNDERTDEWMYPLLETLSDDARSLAYRISVVRTTTSQELIARISTVSREATLRLTRELADKYILRELAPGEYSMYGYIREFLYSKAHDKTRTKAHSAAGSHFVDLAQETTNEQERAECLIEAINHFEKSQRWEAILHNARPAYELLLSFGDADRSYTVANQAVQAARSLRDEEETGYWLLRLIERELGIMQTDEAERHIGESLDGLPKLKPKTPAEERTKWQALEAQIWIQKGRLAYLASDTPTVDKHFERGLALARQSGDRNVIARCLRRVAQIERRRGQYDRAEEHLMEAGSIAHELGESQLLNTCTSQLGLIARRKGDLEEAKRLFSIAYQRAKASGDINGASINFGLLGDIALRTGDYQRAEGIFRKLLRIARRVGNSRGIRITVGWLAEALIGLGKYQEAESLLEEADQRSQEARDGIGFAWTLRRRGLLEHARGNIEIGNRLILTGIQKLKEIGNVDYLPDFEKALRDTPTQPGEKT
jgi:tetratricopeptide (TPR) repeat protein